MFAPAPAPAPATTATTATTATDPAPAPKFMPLQYAVEKITARFTQVINLKDGTWTECDFEDTAAGTRVTNHAVRKAYKRPMAADWAWNADVSFLYHCAHIDVGTVEKLAFAELLYYDKGCMFVKHVDRKLAPNHLGTILFVFNSDDMEGGELHLEQEDGTVTVVAKDPGGCFMVFIPLDMPHWVSEVTRGHRLVAKCPVLGSPKKVQPKEPKPKSDYDRFPWHKPGRKHPPGYAD